MLRRVVVELQQHVGVVDDLRDGLRELRAVVSFERGDRRPRLVGVLGVVDFLHRRRRTRMCRLRKRSKGIRLLVEPTTLLLRLREDLAQRFPEAPRVHRLCSFPMRIPMLPASLALETAEGWPPISYLPEKA